MGGGGRAGDQHPGGRPAAVASATAGPCEAGLRTAAAELPLAAGWRPRGAAGDVARHALLGDAANQCFHGSVFRLRHHWCGGGAGVRQFAGANAPGFDLECIVGALAAYLRQAHGAVGSSAAD